MKDVTERRAVVLLSGGLDSTAAACVARADGFELYGLTFDYGQRHHRELESARNVARALACRETLLIRADLTAIGGSALTSDRIDIPTHRDLEPLSAGSVPPTYVPARNTIFLSYALAWAEVIGADDIFIGVNAIDYSGYPDCRPDFIRAFETMANLSTRAATEEGRRFRIQTPLIDLSKAEIVELGNRLGADFSMTWSCYQPAETGRPCGVCDSCQLRARGFREAGIPDPALSTD